MKCCSSIAFQPKLYHRVTDYLWVLATMLRKRFFVRKMIHKWKKEWLLLGRWNKGTKRVFGHQIGVKPSNGGVRSRVIIFTYFIHSVNISPLYVCIGNLRHSIFYEYTLLIYAPGTSTYTNIFMCFEHIYFCKINKTFNLT